MAPAPAPGSASNDHGPSEVTTLLGRGSEFEGKLSFEGTVRIDGKLSGEIFTDDVLIIGEGAEVNAEIDVGAIVIEGTVHGNIHAKRSVEIHTPGARARQHRDAVAVHRQGRDLRRALPDGAERRRPAGQGPPERRRR